MQWIYIVVMSVFACVAYGIIHDQITARICLEYFTVGHAPVFQTEDPTLLGLGWGILATWWVGVLLGIPLAIFARIGNRPKRSVASLIRPTSILIVCVAIVATVAGAVGLVAASNNWISLHPNIAEQLPPEKHTPFLVDLWIHNASYTAGFIGGLFMMAWVWWTRIKMSETDSE